MREKFDQKVERPIIKRPPEPGKNLNEILAAKKSLSKREFVSKRIDAEKIKNLKSQIETETQEEKKEKLINKTLKEAGISVTMWIPKEQVSDFSGARSEAYNNLTENFLPGKKWGIPWQAIEKDIGAQSHDLSGRRNFLAEHNVNELIDIREVKAPVFETVTIPGSKGFLGFGATPDKVERINTGRLENVIHNSLVRNGKNEPAVQFSYLVASKENYKDAGGRPGKALNASFLLPSSNAAELQKAIYEDPKIMRDLIEAVVKQKFLENNNEAWETAIKDGTSVRPPYEEWDSETNGGNVYIQRNGKGKICNVNSVNQ